MINVEMEKIYSSVPKKRNTLVMDRNFLKKKKSLSVRSRVSYVQKIIRHCLAGCRFPKHLLSFDFVSSNFVQSFIFILESQRTSCAGVYAEEGKIWT
jgi:hypothetical protein